MIDNYLGDWASIQMKKTSRILSFILILVFVLQFIPLLSDNVENLVDHAQSNKASIFMSDIYMGAVILSHENRHLFKLSLTKLKCLFEVQASCMVYVMHKLFQVGIIFDFRQKIEGIMSDYFHGSKYKVGRPII